MSKQILRIERGRITLNTRKYYKNHFSECSFFNWVARIEAHKLGKMVYPTPSKKEVSAFNEVMRIKE